MQADALRALMWTKTKDAEKGRNQPVSIVKLMMGDRKEEDIVSFSDEKEFERFWKNHGGG